MTAWGLGALLSLVLATDGAPALAAEDKQAWSICASLIEAAEQALDLPPHLLQTISKVESGRWREGEEASTAWPWTISAKGKGRYLPNRQAMLREIRKLQARGIKSIDVGCMQVNLMYHGDAFDSLEQAVDPLHNVAYAAVFLSQLRESSRSWTKAVGRYHSRTPKLSGPYRRKVMRAWQQEKRLAAKREAAARHEQVAQLPAAMPEVAPAERPEIPPPPPPVSFDAKSDSKESSALGGIALSGFFGLTN